MRHLLPCLLAAAACAAPAPAVASTVGVQGSQLVVTGEAGERNRFSVAPSGSRIRVTDTRATPTAGAGCTASGRTVSCPAEGLTELVADLGEGDDRIAVARSIGLRGRLRGGAGRDTLIGGGGPDVLDGGPGRDTVSYANRRDFVTVTLGAGADDGAPGEGDDVLPGVDVVLGTAAFDILAGSRRGERLEGRAGDDRLDGGGGADTLVGGRDGDAMVGGDGNDVFVSTDGDGPDVAQGGGGIDRYDYGRRTRGVLADPDGRPDDGERPGGALSFTGELFNLFGSASAERDNLLPDVESVRGGRADDVLGASALGGGVLEGGAGTDVLFGGPATDRLDGGPGFDRLATRDRGPDTLVCGTETDRAFTDDRDLVPLDCEQRSPGFAVGLLIGDRTDGPQPALRVRVVCPPQAAIRCVGAVRARTVRRLRLGRRFRTTRLGAARFNAPAGGAVSVDVALDEDARAVLDRLGRTRVRVTARGRDEAGRARSSATQRILG